MFATMLVLASLLVARFVFMDAQPHGASTSREARITTDSGVVLAGTLSFPEGARRPDAPPLPAVIFVGGSGPQDRDGARIELSGYLPFRELAASLNGAGMAVLRVDDRGTGSSTGRFEGATTLDFARDVDSSVAWLRRQPGIDASRIAILGHSEGALVALIAASHDTLLSSLVLLGAPSRTGRELARWQRSALVSSDLARYPAASRGAVLAAAEDEAEGAAGRDAWLHTWFALDPRDIARRTRAPVLLLHGENDRQVPVVQSDELAKVLRERSFGGARAIVEVMRFPSTDHLFLEDHDGDPQGYVRLADRHLRPDVVDAVREWLTRRR